jgi:hypothetical protein
MSSQGVMSSKKACNNRGLRRVRGQNLALVPRQGPEISSQPCLWVMPRHRQQFQCWVTNKQLILLLMSCLETRKAGSGPTNLEEQPIGSPSKISLPLNLYL